ncbi:MAG TPA: HD domain-containing phosphohydrolase [Candidatus Eisenbacteria bacterium]|nr:HD domain-containing phosphohydrolase [Candidatus Eisenbacteria bacterium]
MALETRTTTPSRTSLPAVESLPGALALLGGLNHVARALVPFDPGGTSLAQVVLGVKRILHPDGTAILIRGQNGEYLFKTVDGVFNEWNRYYLSGSAAEILDKLLERDTVLLFKKGQKSPWAREFLFAEGMAWGAAAPIRPQGERVGALLLNHSTALPFRPEHVASLQNLATLAGIAEREDSHRAHLEDLFMGVIVSLTMALEAKDPYTEGHSARVAAYSEAIGKQLGMQPEQLDVVHRSCLVHDLGKIAVDGSILGKEEGLSSHEREKMDLHPVIGEDILRPITLLKPLLPGVRSHHEHYDGTGYPDGLAGEAIPIEARIMAVADAFDAMTSNRPYRKALPEEDALAELRRNAGTHFDPRIVAAFEQIYPAVKRTLEHLRPRS